jgi:hydrogenase nickel incorporation protein HypA/HybF
MHELTLSKNILEIVQQESFARKFQKVKLIYLELGELMAVEKSALLFSFEVIARGTLAENAVLNIIDIPGQGWCEFCQKTVKIRRRIDPCDGCQKFLLKILAGEELRVKSMEVEACAVSADVVK